MLWKRNWRPETVMLLVGGILLAFFSASLAVDLLRRAGIAGFRAPDDCGSVLLATLGFWVTGHPLDRYAEKVAELTT